MQHSQQGGFQVVIVLKQMRWKTFFHIHWNMYGSGRCFQKNPIFCKTLGLGVVTLWLRFLRSIGSLSFVVQFVCSTSGRSHWEITLGDDTPPHCNTLVAAILWWGKKLTYWEESVKCILTSKVSIYYQINSTISPNSFYTSCKQLACVTRTHLKAFCGFSSFSHIGVFLVFSTLVCFSLAPSKAILPVASHETHRATSLFTSLTDNLFMLQVALEVTTVTESFEILKHWGHHSIWLTREEVGDIHKLCHQLKSIQEFVICKFRLLKAEYWEQVRLFIGSTFL